MQNAVGRNYIRWLKWHKPKSLYSLILHITESSNELHMLTTTVISITASVQTNK